MNRYGPAAWYRGRPNPDERQLRRWWWSDTLLRIVEEYGIDHLYAADWEQVEANNILDECARELKCYPQTRVLGFAVMPIEASASNERIPWCRECLGFSLRQFKCDAGWQCEVCHGPYGEVWGCLGCARVVCGECVELRHDDEGGWTLKEVGELLGVSGERIRSIQCRALRKLQHPIRAGLLRRFFTRGH